MKKSTRLAFALMAAVLVFGLSACGVPDTSAQKTGQQQTESAFKTMQDAVPYVAPTDSLERKNLAERLKRTDNPNALGYVYVMSLSGKIIGYYAIKGKVSNPNSQLTTDNLIVSKHQTPVVVNAPGDDGSYGPNEEGIFFFTTEDVMVTTNLYYQWSDAPLAVDVPRLNPKK